MRAISEFHFPETSGAESRSLKVRSCGLGFLLLGGALASAAHATILWEGREVAEWPDQHLSALGKSSAGSRPPAAGFYPAPKGIVYGLTMIVDFSDSPAKFTREQVDDWLNKPGFVMGSTKGSVRDYYLEVSNGQVDLRNDVVGYYRAKNTKAYYEDNSASELTREMIEYFDAQGVDFSKYDNDKNGTTESISFVYAGRPKGRDNGALWPHSGGLGMSKDGVKLGRYNMSDMSDNLTLYVFAHETGHMVFGWPDLYWFGDWCIMGNRMSDVNPQAINGDDVLVVWADSRAGDVDVYFSRGKGLAASGIVAAKDPKIEAARIKAAWTTTALFDVKGARVEASGNGRRPAPGKYLPGKAEGPAR